MEINWFLKSNLIQPAELCKPGFTYSTWKHFTKNEEKIQEFKETRDSRYISQNELYKAYFQHDMTYGDFKDLPRRTVSDRVFRDEEFNILKNSKYDEYRQGLA